MPIIAVAFKWARSLDEARALPVLTDDDAVAIAVGRRLADEVGAELVGVTVGVEAAQNQARKTVMAHGLDRLLVVPADVPTESTTARLVAGVVQRLNADWLLTGGVSIDEGAGLVPALVGGRLGWPTVLNTAALSWAGDRLQGKRPWRGGTQTVQIAGPAVVGVAVEAAQPKRPGMRDLMAAAKRPVELWDATELGITSTVCQVVASEPVPPRQRRGVVIDATDVAAAAKATVAELRQMGALR